MKKLIGLVVLVIVAVGVYKFSRKTAEAPTVENKETAPLATSVGSEQDTVERIATSVATDEKKGVAPVATSISNENLRVSSPTPDATVTSPFVVAGEARVFENIVNVRVTNLKGDVFIQETAYAKAPDAGQFGPFSINLSYKFKNTKEGFVEVYHASPKDGSEQDLVRIPVKFE